MGIQVKICGLKKPEDVEAVSESEADYAGFVFYEKSRRNVSIAAVRDLLSRLDPKIRSVAVCVNPTKDLLDQFVQLGFDRIQIHGAIDAKLTERVKIPVWQAVNLSGRKDLQNIMHDPIIDGCVIDGAQFGGGKTFGWEGGRIDETVPTPEEIRIALDGRKFILAGGLSPLNVSEAIRLFSPDVVDVSSGVENDQGKDRNLIFQFIREVRKG